MDGFFVVVVTNLFSLDLSFSGHKRGRAEGIVLSWRGGWWLEQILKIKPDVHIYWGHIYTQGFAFFFSNPFSAPRKKINQIQFINDAGKYRPADAFIYHISAAAIIWVIYMLMEVIYECYVINTWLILEWNMNATGVLRDWYVIST